jgi:osmotically inducible lipoprotein OsmB
MNRKLMVSCVLIGAMTLTGCANMSDTQRRTTTGAAIGGVTAGAISGEWGWAAAGAAVGAASGYLYDKHKKAEESK